MSQHSYIDGGITMKARGSRFNRVSSVCGSAMRSLLYAYTAWLPLRRPWRHLPYVTQSITPPVGGSTLPREHRAGLSRKPNLANYSPPWLALCLGGEGSTSLCAFNIMPSLARDGYHSGYRVIYHVRRTVCPFVRSVQGIHSV